MKILFLLITTIFLITESFALTSTWQRTNNGRWDNVNNWDNGIPTATDTAIIDGISGTANVNTGSSFTVNKLLLINEAILNVRGDLTVNGTTELTSNCLLNSRGVLTMNGLVIIGEEANIKTGGSNGAEIFINGDVDFQNLSGLITNARNSSFITFNGDLLNKDNAANNFTRGTTSYLSNSDQNISAGQYRNLILEDSGIKLINDGTVTVTRDLIANDAIISVTDGILGVQNSSTVDFGTSTVKYEKSGDQIIPDFDANFHNLVIAGSGIKALENGLSALGINNNLIIDSGTLNTSNSTVSIGKDFENNGSYSQTEGTIIFNGNSASSISGNSNLELFNLTLDKSSPVTTTFNSIVDILPEGEVTLTSNNDDLLVNNQFTLNADATGYSIIGEIPDGSSVSGNITVEAYFNASQRSWWHVSSPTQNTSATDWADDLIITGEFNGNRNDDIVGADRQSMFVFDETSSESQSDSWLPFPSADISESMTVGKGYRIFIRDDAETVSPVTVNHTGTINQGEVTLPLTYTNTSAINPTSSSDNDGWNLIGNPYPASLDWGQVDKSSLAFGSAFVWNANTKAYDKFGTDITIAPFQAFFVKANSTENDITVTESMKTTSTPLQRTGIKQNVITVNIEETNPERLFNYASTEITLDPYADENIDFDLDAGYLSRNFLKKETSQPLVDIGSVSPDGIKFKSNYTPTKAYNKIPLHVEFSDYDEFRINVNLKNYSESKEIYLEDNYLNTHVKLNSSDEINHIVSTSNDEASKSSNRFNLHIGDYIPSNETTETSFTSTVNIFPNPATSTLNYELRSVFGNVTLTISDALGHVISSETIPNTADSLQGSKDITTLTSGIYFLTISTVEKTETTKFTVK